VLLARMTGARARRRTVLGAELVVRGSTGPPRR
jgi:DNA-binding LacI/PurR family transcriptional regulator